MVARPARIASSLIGSVFIATSSISSSNSAPLAHFMDTIGDRSRKTCDNIRLGYQERLQPHPTLARFDSNYYATYRFFKLIQIPRDGEPNTVFSRQKIGVVWEGE